MNMIYNSPNYCVVEFPDQSGVRGGYEILDKLSRREIFLDGLLALRFRRDVSELIAAEPTVEQVDEFLSGFDGLMQQPVSLH
ncbi:MAG: DUF3567 domain-containing protein [Quisquiliibacterium sp.]